MHPIEVLVCHTEHLRGKYLTLRKQLYYVQRINCRFQTSRNQPGFDVISTVRLIYMYDLIVVWYTDVDGKKVSPPMNIHKGLTMRSTFCMTRRLPEDYNRSKCKQRSVSCFEVGVSQKLTSTASELVNSVTYY